MENEMYYIGEVGEKCKITKKALRYYDKMGILSPDQIIDENGYRYYSKNNILDIPIIKYYKQSGFKLDEIKSLLVNNPYYIYEKKFKEKIDELKEIEKELNLKIKSLADWYNLIIEAEMVIEQNLNEVSVKYIDKHRMTFLDQDFNYDYMESIINIEFTNYIDSIKNAITGPVIIGFPSYEDKLQGKCNKMKIIQKTILKCEEDETIELGGCMVASCYHIGPHETINEAYKKMKAWIDEHGYICEEGCYERYVVDYWTSKDSNSFVTEILIKIKRGKGITIDEKVSFKGKGKSEK